MHEPELISSLEENRWNHLLISTQRGSVFHTMNWAAVLSKSYNYQPLYLCAENHQSFSMMTLMEIDSIITGRRGVCLPFTDCCEPIAENAQQFQNLFDRAVVMGRNRRWKYLEIRGGEEYLSAEKPSQIFFGHTLDLTCGQRQLFSNLRDSTRRNIQKAQKENVHVSISASPQSMKDFYRLNLLTRREHGLPPQPYAFFRHLYDQLIARDMGVVITASIKGHPIAAGVYLNFGKDVIYKYGASEKSWQHLRANNLVMWEAIKWSCERGFENFNFGRTEKENEGLRQFKQGWGAREYIIKYYRYDFCKQAFVGESFSVNSLYRKIIKTLPGPVLNMMGNVLYRHVG